MEALTIVGDEFKRLTKTANDLAHSLLNSGRRSPIEILKRLQREAFSDIMKLRDRQDKVERILSYYKSSKASPFHEASTHVSGNVDVQGAFFVVDDIDENKYDTIQSSGIRTGIDARLKFKTAVRENDQLLAEFTANGSGDMMGGPLSLAKVLYTAHFNDWFSAVAIPLGAQCRDVGFVTSAHQEKGLTSYSDFEPPLLHQNNGAAIGMTVRKINLVASLARFVSGFGMQDNADELECSSSTFAHIVWQLSRSTNLSLSGVHRKFRAPGQNISLGAFAFPASIFKRNRSLDVEGYKSDGSISLMFNTEIDDNTKIGGWIETKTSDTGQVQWAVRMSDAPEDELGWCLTLGGLLQGPKSLEHFQAETYLNMNFGRRFTLQPGLVYVKNGVTQFPALTIRSSWSL